MFAWKLGLSMAISIFVFALLQHAVCAAFDHDVGPSTACLKSSTTCTFVLTLSRGESMVLYQRDKAIGLNNGYPVYMSGSKAFYRKNCTFNMEVSAEEFKGVVTADGRTRSMIMVNSGFPGTSIVVYEGQTVIIKVKNHLHNDDTSIHWHGMTQQENFWMDGVAGITQCPINPSETFTYKFKATPAGTHLYHSHYGTQRTDGLFGAFIVHPNDNSENYDGDFLMFVNDWFLEESDVIVERILTSMNKFSYNYDFTKDERCHDATLQSDKGDVGIIPFESALINGKGRHYENKSETPLSEVPYYTYTVNANMKYRFRLINPSMIYGFRVSIAKHKLHVFRADAYAIKEIEANYVIVQPGERFDFYINTDQTPATYWIKAETLEVYKENEIKEKPGYVLAQLMYSHSSTIDNAQDWTCTQSSPCVAVNCPFQSFNASTATKCVNFDNITGLEDYVGATDGNGVEEHILSFHFAPDGTSMKTSNGSSRSSVNAKRFVLPSTPPYQFGICDPKFDDACETCNQDATLCQCTHMINLPANKTVQLVLFSSVPGVNTHDPVAAAHPVHLHGHHFYVMKVGYPTLNDHGGFIASTTDLVCDNDRCEEPKWKPEWRDLNGNVPGLRFIKPPRKDTIAVPIGGYVVIRFMSDNPGYWFMHCHIEPHQAEGMSLLIREAGGIPPGKKPTPIGFPTCGSFYNNDLNLLTDCDSPAPTTPAITSVGNRVKMFAIPQILLVVMVTSMLLS